MSHFQFMSSLLIVSVFFLLFVISSTSQSCLYYKNGRDYTGKINITSYGNLCKPWSLASEEYSLSKLKIKNYEENFCRNPNGSHSLWCYTSRDTIEHCSVPFCPTNPQANYCIGIPKIHLRSCPAIFRKTLLIEDFDLNVTFCCVSNNTEILNILPKNSCVIAVVRSHFLQEHFAVCPNEFYGEPVKENVLASNVIYKCCKNVESGPTFTQRFKELTSKINTNGSILAAIVLKNTLCPILDGLISSTIEYHGMDKISKDILPSKMILCFYFKKTTKVKLDYSQLGFLTFKECPSGFIQSNDNLRTFIYGSTKLNYCWPQYRSNLYSNETLCLNVREVLNTATVCPANFQEYYILSALNIIPLSRLCCRFQKDDYNINFTNVNVTDVTMGFITPSDTCAFYKANISIRPIIIKSLIDIYQNQKLISNPLFSICIYELQKDEFAYKKIGSLCPEKMFSSKALFISSTNETNQFLNKLTEMKFCVGNGHFTMQSFPKGKYCVYKISTHCPLGFISVSHVIKRTIVDKKKLIPDYNSTYICCRNDSENNQTISSGSMPFINLSNSISFGLLLLNHYKYCPIIYGYISYLESDVDRPFCSYRTKIEYYRWRHEILWPDVEGSGIYSDRINNPTVIKPWRRYNTWAYRSSIIHKYPRNEYCILSYGSCLNIKDVRFNITYPIKDFFVCCRLRKDYFTEESLTSIQVYNISHNYSAGYLAVHGKCPHVDQNLFTLHGIVKDTFQINAENFNNQYGINLIKIGIIPDITSLKKFIKLDFKFCIFHSKVRASQEDPIHQKRLAEFIKPIHLFCPMGYREVQTNISLNLEEDLSALAKHFVNGKSLTLCIPIINLTNNQTLEWPSSLCRISQKKCSKNWNYFNLYINDKVFTESCIHRPFQMCCSKINQNSKFNESFPQQFALPLSFDDSKCPEIQRFLSVLLNIPLVKTVQLKEFRLCYYYQQPNLADWPTGSYFTISYDNQCPLGFQLAKYNDSNLCMRKDSTPSLAQFPEGNYCILTFIDRLCPPTVTWRSRLNFIGLDNNILNLCCSLSSNIIFNIPYSKESVFSFISVDKCSIIPGMKMKENSFLSLERLSQCIYISEVCDKCENLSRTKPTKSDLEASLINRQNIIIFLLLFLLFIIITLTSTFIIYYRINQARRNSNMDSNMKLSAIYTQIDYCVDEKDNSDEEISSVAYSTVL